MMQPVYILSASIVSPQQHFEDSGFLQDIKEYAGGVLSVVEPNYRGYINPVAIRRMSKLLKMGISCGMNALQQANIEKPQAIITGTGRGSMVDTEQFLMSMIENEEEVLTPTSFIQSTYNSINGWLALQTKCTGYNQTYVNRGTSFELALFDALMLLNEAEEEMQVLAGCFDEITPDYIKVKSKIGYWKKPAPVNIELYQHSETQGTIAGEGTAFFTLSNKAENAICSLQAVKTMQDAQPVEVMDAINRLLDQHGLALDAIDVLLCGMNGDSRQQPLYDELADIAGEHTTIAAFKHLCGEYDTSSGFATWIATEMFRAQEIPGTLVIKKGSHKEIKNILLVNHYILNSHSILLLQNVQ
ncbi:MAG TPA: beta-ketoacyl synthase chain length factor [Flavipsychrobacter sp.]